MVPRRRSAGLVRSRLFMCGICGTEFLSFPFSKTKNDVSVCTLLHPDNSSVNLDELWSATSLLCAILSWGEFKVVLSAQWRSDVAYVTEVDPIDIEEERRMSQST